MEKVTGCVAINVMSGTTKYALVRKARGSLFVVDAIDQNCTTKWSELYLQTYNFDQFKGVSNFLYNYKY
jgi:hypothetical protein